MNDFWNEINESGIRFRDHLQFELKTEFDLEPFTDTNTFRQDIYLFIPESLQINKETYSKNQFYSDETNLIRYRTPQLSFEQLIDTNYSQSPLNRLYELKDKLTDVEAQDSMIKELKLYGDMFQSTLRDRVAELLTELKSEQSSTKKHLQFFCQSIHKVRHAFSDLKKTFFNLDLPDRLRHAFAHVDEFIGHILNHYILGFLKELRQYDRELWIEEDRALCTLIIEEQAKLDQLFATSKNFKNTYLSPEFILYRLHLLSKFMLEPLLLKTTRHSLQEKHSTTLGALAAGIAMFVYMILLWKSTAFAINSFPFVLIVVILYILKDRIKEGLKVLYIKKASRWFPDYSTHITNLSGYNMGKLTENVSFIEEKDLPSAIRDVRSKEFDEELKMLKRHEKIIHYKRNVIINPEMTKSQARRKQLTLIFRFNIHRFLRKAANPLQSYLSLNHSSLSINETLLPKVYHLNVIIKNTYPHSKMQSKIELKKFRIIIDKTGIRRVEHL